MFWGVADRLEAEVGHAFAGLGVLRGVDEERVQLLDDGARGAGGGENAVPAEDVEAGEAGFGDGGKVGREDGALGGGDGEAAALSGLDLREPAGPTVNMTWSWPPRRSVIAKGIVPAPGRSSVATSWT